MSRTDQSQASSRWLALPFPDQTVGRVDMSLSSKKGPKAGQFSGSDDESPITDAQDGIASASAIP